jgi:enoyl-CoA hydratase
MSSDNPIEVEYSRDGRAAHIRLNRPEKNNALDTETVRQLREAVETIETDDSVRVVTIRGAGGNFSAGADLASLEDSIQAGDHEAVEEFLAEVQHALTGLSNLPVPVIAIVEGFALAGGIETLLACDLAIASDDAVIGDQHANYGLIGGGGSTQRLARVVGTRKAKELIFTGSRIDGAQASDIGLVNRNAPPDELDEQAEQFVDEIATKGRQTTETAKHLVETSQSTDLETGLELERAVVSSHLFSEDAQEGLAAFNEGREPDF